MWGERKLWHTEKIQGSMSLRISKHINRVNRITIKSKQKPHKNNKNKPNQQTKITKKPQQAGNSTLFSYVIDTKCNYQTVSQSSESGTRHLKSDLNPAAYSSKKYFWSGIMEIKPKTPRKHYVFSDNVSQKINWNTAFPTLYSKLLQVKSIFSPHSFRYYQKVHKLESKTHTWPCIHMHEDFMKKIKEEKRGR